MGVPSAITSELQYFAAATTVIFFLGIKDDILILSAAKKFIGQLIAAGIVIKFGGVQITHLHGFFGFNEMPNFASIVFTLFTVIVIVNSFNLIDGVDGLAGSLGLLTALVFGSYFAFIGQTLYAVMAFSLAGSLIGFLIYNFSPAKIFMGDTGSLLIGLLNSIFVIKFINLAAQPDVVLPIASAPAVGCAILIVPLFDTLRVFTLRMLSLRSPFSPERNHIHQFLINLGLNHKKVVLVCVTANILFIGLAWSLQSMGTTLVVGALASAAVLFVGIVYYSRPKSKLIHPTNGRAKEKEIAKAHKIFSLAG